MHNYHIHATVQTLFQHVLELMYHPQGVHVPNLKSATVDRITDVQQAKIINNYKNADNASTVIYTILCI
jgi:hypothetical protein